MALSDEDYVSAAEAASILGVSVSTLYVYVGRKGLRTRAVPGTRKRQYLRSDLEAEVARRAQPKSTAATASSAITQITPEGPRYRGVLATELMETATVEQCAARLWGISVEDAFGNEVSAASPELAAMLRAAESASAISRATNFLHMLEGTNPRAFDMSRAGMARTGAEIMRWLAAIMFNLPAASPRGVHEVVAAALQLDDARADLLRRLFVLGADHGLDATTKAVRSVAATGVTPWRTVGAGLLVSTGRRSGSEHSRTVRQLIADILTEDDPRSPLLHYLRHGRSVPGFGSELYGGRDPRARALLASCRTLLPASRDVDALETGLSLMREWGDLEPDFPFVRAFVSRILGVDHSDPLFALARCSGWLAHGAEEYLSEERRRVSRTDDRPLREVSPHHPF